MVLVTSWEEGQQDVTPAHAANSQRVTGRKDGGNGILCGGRLSRFGR